MSAGVGPRRGCSSTGCSCRHRWSPDGGDAEEEQSHTLLRRAHAANMLACPLSFHQVFHTSCLCAKLTVSLSLCFVTFDFSPDEDEVDEDEEDFEEDDEWDD